jgi:hypothetical protein
MSTTLPLNLDRALANVDQMIVANLQSLISDKEDYLKAAYTKVMGYLSGLSQFMQKKKKAQVEYFGRNFSLWRKPTLRQQSLKLVSYQLTKEETWQVWASDVDIESFVNNSAPQLISFIIDGFCSELSDALLEMQSFLRSKQQDFVQSMTKLQTHLQEFNDSTLINEKFVSGNLLKVDIYFGEMKYEQIDQVPSYDITTFFSDFGGFIGLLLGGSVISIFEIIDLFFYNAIIKATARRKIRPTSAPNSNVIKVKSLQDKCAVVNVEQRP